MLLVFFKWQDILPCAHLYMENVHEHSEVKRARQQQNKTKSCFFWSAQNDSERFGTTLFLSLHKSTEMKRTDASIQFENTAFRFHLIALYLWKTSSAPQRFFPPTLDCIVELQLLDWSGQNVKRHSFFKVQFTQNRERKHQHTTSGYKDLVCFDTKVRERGKWDPGEHIKAEKTRISVARKLTRRAKWGQARRDYRRQNKAVYHNVWQRRILIALDTNVVIRLPGQWSAMRLN